MIASRITSKRYRSDRGGSCKCGTIAGELPKRAMEAIHNVFG